MRLELSGVVGVCSRTVSKDISLCCVLHFLSAAWGGRSSCVLYKMLRSRTCEQDSLQRLALVPFVAPHATCDVESKLWEYECKRCFAGFLILKRSNLLLSSRGRTPRLDDTISFRYWNASFLCLHYVKQMSNSRRDLLVNNDGVFEM